ncbi:MAG: hypothetical protein GWN97_16835, partial [Thermoplasmata archaeon]|nr:hypothetical protein [Thermoplasmata archaeon]NIT78947.1 hypothetical protein [Thermoplasmata archaeon]NIY05315.1 hypothetical protein [Thermoplasmata archaeon]
VEAEKEALRLRGVEEKDLEGMLHDSKPVDPPDEGIEYSPPEERTVNLQGVSFKVGPLPPWLLSISTGPSDLYLKITALAEDGREFEGTIPTTEVTKKELRVDREDNVAPDLNETIRPEGEPFSSVFIPDYPESCRTLGHGADQVGDIPVDDSPGMRDPGDESFTYCPPEERDENAARAGEEENDG